jgi:DHA1 family bicyclomycin/chloramphenicol resistance-like MFS transporter
MMDSQAATAAPRGIVPLLLTIVPLSQIPLDAYTPAMPEMVRDLASTNAFVQNTVTSYMLGMCLALIPIGMFADAFGRKRVLLSGMVVMIAGSIACALAPDVWTLILLRFIQGMGACACLVVTYAVAADCFQGKKLVAISGLLGAAWGLAPVLAPAAGGLLAQFTSWRVIFGLIAALGAVAAALAAIFLPETLPAEQRSPLNPGATLRILSGALKNSRFVCFTLIFSVMASAQMVFGVVAPFLYQVKLGFEPAAYGLIALGLGAANLSGELACSTLATRISARQLCFGAWAIYAAGALVLALTGTLQGVTLWAITLGGALTLLGCGTLCPTMYGMALGLFSKNLGLLGGVITSICYLAVTITMALAAYLPETSQAPLGWMYVALAAIGLLLLAISLSKSQPEVSAHGHS